MLQPKHVADLVQHCLHRAMQHPRGRFGHWHVSRHGVSHKAEDPDPTSKPCKTVHKVPLLSGVEVRHRHCQRAKRVAGQRRLHQRIQDLPCVPLCTVLTGTAGGPRMEPGQRLRGQRLHLQGVVEASHDSFQRRPRRPRAVREGFHLQVLRVTQRLQVDRVTDPVRHIGPRGEEVQEALVGRPRQHGAEPLVGLWRVDVLPLAT
mmetsp:Transcript_69117/g.179594  ORF Transcript_69117/g.179594 Transcript_69117/m.179594 type:complete len:204 (+) Transcript_69117:576-1187(+)